MKGKNIRKEGRGLKERRAQSDIDIELTQDDISANEPKYRIKYGKNSKATITCLEGPNKNQTAIYNGMTNEWSGVKVLPGIKSSIERYYS